MRLMTIRDVQAVTSLGRTTVSGLLSSGRLPHYRIGGAVRVSDIDLKAYLDGVRIGAAIHTNTRAGARTDYYGGRMGKRARRPVAGGLAGGSDGGSTGGSGAGDPGALAQDGRDGVPDVQSSVNEGKGQ